VFGKLSLEITCFSLTWLLTRKRRRRRNSKIIFYYHLTGYWIFFIRFIYHCDCCNYQRQNNLKVQKNNLNILKTKFLKLIPTSVLVFLTFS
jgi:hypothetical protein